MQCNFWNFSCCLTMVSFQTWFLKIFPHFFVCGTYGNPEICEFVLSNEIFCTNSFFHSISNMWDRCKWEKFLMKCKECHQGRYSGKSRDPGLGSVSSPCLGFNKALTAFQIVCFDHQTPLS